jgi:hypothetical protein
LLVLRSAAANEAILVLVSTANPAAAAGENHPFPTHVTYKTGVMPSASQADRDSAVKKQYDSWKKAYLRSACDYWTP